MKGLTTAILFTIVFPILAIAQNTYNFEDKDLQVNLTAGWVAKEWRTTINGRTVREDMWGNPNKMLHGLQLGFVLSKGLYYGLGFRTGLNYEWYLSFDKQIKDMGFKRFSEHSLYIPVHAMVRMFPLRNRAVSITPFGGIGFNWAMMGKLKSGPMAITDKYGFNKVTGRQYPLELFDYNNYTPHHWNVQAEAGVAIRLKAAEISFTYSWGLNHHQLYENLSSRQNKLAANISLVMPPTGNKRKSSSDNP